MFFRFSYLRYTSIYPPHSGEIGLSSYDTEKATFPHFTNGHLFCYSFFFTASVPQKEMKIHHYFHGSIMFVNLKRGAYRYKKSMPGTPFAVLKCCGEKLLRVEGPTLWSKMETGSLPMKYLFPRGAIHISVYLKKTKSSVHAILVEC